MNTKLTLIILLCAIMLFACAQLPNKGRSSFVIPQRRPPSPIPTPQPAPPIAQPAPAPTPSPTCVGNVNTACTGCKNTTGKILCDGNCSSKPPPNFGQPCGCAGTIDCDGKSCTRLCASGQNCQNGACVTPVAPAPILAPAPSCSDGMKNSWETDVDCGGPVCPNKCSPGKSCAATSDCTTASTCVNRVCQPTTDKEVLSIETRSWHSPYCEGAYCSCGLETFCLLAGSTPDCDSAGQGVRGISESYDCPSARVGYKHRFYCPSGTAENAQFKCGLSSPAGDGMYGVISGDQYVPYNVAYSGNMVTVTCEKQFTGTVPCAGMNSMSGQFFCYNHNTTTV